MSATRPTWLRGLALAVAAFTIGPARASVAAAPPVPYCQTVINITQAPASPTGQTTGNVTVEYGEIVTTNPVCLSVEGGQSFAFTVNGVDRTTSFTYGYNSTTGLNEAYGTNVPLVAGMTNTLVATTEGGRPAGDIGPLTDTVQVVVTAPTVAVTPDNGSADARPSRQNMQSFTVVNGQTAGSYNLTAACTGTATSCAPTASSITLAASSSSIVTVAYQTGATGTTGTVKLISTLQTNAAVKDSGSVNVTVRAVGSPLANVDSVNPGTSIERDLCLTIAMGSGAASECGDLRLTFALPTTRTKNKARTPTLLYNSQHAHPYPLVAANITIPGTIAPPDSVTAKVLFGSTTKASGTWAGTDFVTGGTRRIVLGFEALTLPTGLYPYTLEVKSWYDSDPAYTQTVASSLVIVNRSYLGSGAGWWIAGVEYLYFPGSSQILWVGGDGSTRLYQPAPSTVVNGATRCNWAAAALDRPDTISSNCSATYTRHAAHGVKIEFEGSRHVRTINRLGDVTTFTWHQNFQRVESIKIPPTTANLTYSFYYNATSGFIDSIVAPPADTQRRVITVSTDVGVMFNPGWGNMLGGRITALRGPDTSRVQIAYVSTSYRAKSRTDRRGTVRSFTYDAGQRITGDSLAMGAGSPDIVTALQPQETQGLIGSGRPGATDTALVSSLMDGPRSDVGDTTRFWLSRWGAPTKIRDALGRETQIARADSRWPALVTRLTRPNGFASTATYDVRGNVLTTTDLAPLGAGSPDATTTFAWDSVFDFVTLINPPEGDSTAISYDAQGNRAWQQDQRGSTSRVSFGYRSDGLLETITVVDPRFLWLTSSITYDGLGNVSSTRSPGNDTVAFYKDAVGRDTLVDTKVVDPLAWAAGARVFHVTQRTWYDASDRDTLSVAGAPADEFTDLGCSCGPLFLRWEKSEVRVRKGYDPEGHLVRLMRDVAAVKAGYPDARVHDSLTTRWTFDRANRQITEIAPDGKRDSTAYDVAGNASMLFNRLDQPIALEYDALDRLTKRTLSIVYYPDTTYATVRMPHYQSSNGTYIWPNGAYSMSVPGDVQTFTYDPSTGQLDTAANRNARVIRSYYPNGLVQREEQQIRKYAGALDFSAHRYVLTFKYDRNGRRLSLRHPEQFLTYPSRGQSRLDSLSTYGYTPFGALATLTDPLRDTYRFYYDALGRADSLAFPNGVGEKRRYDREGRLDSLFARTLAAQAGFAGSNQDIIHDLTMQYESRAKVAAATGYAGGNFVKQYFRYTPAGPLGFAANEYVYNGSWTRSSAQASVGDALGTTVKSYNTAASGKMIDSTLYSPTTGRVADQFWSDGNANWQSNENLVFDAAGNTRFTHQNRFIAECSGYACSSVTRRRLDEVLGQYYGSDGRLAIVDRKSNGIYDDEVGGLEEHFYDALGRRVLRRYRSDVTQNGWLYRYVYDGDNVLYELSLPGSEFTPVASMEEDHPTVGTDSARFDRHGVAYYTHAGGIDRPLSVTRIDWDGVYRAPDSATVYLHPGWHGRFDMGSTLAGKKAWQHFDWDTKHMTTRFSGARSPQGASPKPWFGSVVDGYQDKSGLMYKRNRFYDPGTGRFTQEDPIGLAGGLSTYGFAAGDPVNYSDPLGLSPGACCWEYDGDPKFLEREAQWHEDLAIDDYKALMGITGAAAVGGFLGLRLTTPWLLRLAPVAAPVAGVGKALADSRITIPEGQTLLAIVRNGRVIAQTADIMMSHARLVEKTFGTITAPHGAWVGTVGKTMGQINTLNSQTIMGNQNAAPGAIQDLMRTLFR